MQVYDELTKERHYCEGLTPSLLYNIHRKEGSRAMGPLEFFPEGAEIDAAERAELEAEYQAELAKEYQAALEARPPEVQGLAATAQAHGWKVVIPERMNASR